MRHHSTPEEQCDAWYSSCGMAHHAPMLQGQSLGYQTSTSARSTSHNITLKQGVYVECSILCSCLDGGLQKGLCCGAWHLDVARVLHPDCLHPHHTECHQSCVRCNVHLSLGLDRPMTALYMLTSVAARVKA